MCTPRVHLQNSTRGGGSSMVLAGGTTVPLVWITWWVAPNTYWAGGVELCTFKVNILTGIEPKATGQYFD
jgi:hypothetical protein